MPDMIEARSSGNVSTRYDHMEDFVDGGGSGDVVIGSSGLIRLAVIIQKIDIDPVGVMRCADWDNRFERSFGLASRFTGHTATIVDEKDGVKVSEKRIFRVSRCLHRSGDNSC